jgi:hypothetical protein
MFAGYTTTQSSRLSADWRVVRTRCWGRAAWIMAGVFADRDVREGGIHRQSAADLPT